MANFEVRTEQRSGELVVRLSGELDLAAFDAVDEVLANAQSDGHRTVRIDLRGLEFIDSTGLGGLLELRSMLRAKSVTLEIVAGDGPVRQAVEITGLAELLAT